MKVESTSPFTWEGPIGSKSAKELASAQSFPNIQSSDKVTISNEALEAKKLDDENSKYAGIPPKGFGELYMQLFKVIFEEAKEKATRNLPPGESLSEQELTAIADKTRKEVLAKLGLNTEPADMLTASDTGKNIKQEQINIYLTT